MVLNVPTLITLPQNATPETPAISRARTASSKLEANASAPYPTPSAMDNVAPTRTLVLPRSAVVLQRLTCRQGCSSALPRPPKMARKSIASSHKRGAPGSHSGGLLNLGADVSLTLGGSNHHPGSPGTTSGGSQPGSSGLDINGLVNVLLGSLDISGPILGGNQSSGLEANLYICIGAGVSGSQGLLDTIADVVNSLLSSLLGTTINCKVESSCSVPADNGAVAIDLQICGLSGGSLESTLDKTLKAVVDLLNGLLGDAKITTNCSVDGPGCPATPTLSSSNHPHPSPPTSVETPCPSVRPSPPSTPHSGLDLSGLLNVAPEQIEGILGDLGLTSGDYNLDAVVDLVVGVSVGLGDTLGSVDGLTSNVVDLVDEILDLLLGADVTTQPNPNPTSPPTHSHPGQGIVIDIDLGAVVNVTLSDTGDLVNGVVSAVSGVLVSLLDLDVTVNVDGGHACGCSGSGKASAKN